MRISDWSSDVCSSDLISGKNRAIENQKLAYFELLSDVSEYHDQFAQITENLESNQAFLLSMLESGAEAEADIAAIEQRLKDNKTEEVRVAVASGGLREKLQRFEGDLHEIARSEEHTSELQSLMRISY